jgi:hypothetical protein
MNVLDRFMETFVSRSDDFALQRADGGYVRVGRPLGEQDVRFHLAGARTLGSYVIDEEGCCRYAVFDADSDDGLLRLHAVQGQLAGAGIPSCLEASRRGGHLWVLLAEPVRASQVRAWLLPYRPDDMEFYPKQDEGHGYGSLIRVPLGMHRLAGARYPFVEWTPAGPRPVARELITMLTWLASRERVAPRQDRHPTHPQEKSLSPCSPPTPLAASSTIRGWCAAQDPSMVIGRYVALNSRGQGCCPFSWHHANGRDSRASLKVYRPGIPGGWCWYCYTWHQGGSVFDFLRYYHGLDARSLWRQLQEGVLP